jgi:replication factor C subunit 2/4
MPFVEKYRPETLEDVVGNTIAIEQLKNIVQFGNMPNLILVVSEFPFIIGKGTTRHR